MTAGAPRGRRPLTGGLLLADMGAFALAMLLSVALLAVFRSQRIGGDLQQWFWLEGRLQLATFAVLEVYALLRFWALGSYRRRQPFWDELRDCLSVVTSAALLHVLVLVLLKGTVSRFLVPLSWLSLLVLLPLLRACARSLLQTLGRWELPIIVVGCGPHAVAAARALLSEARLGFVIRDWVVPAPVDPDPTLEAVPRVLPGDAMLAWLRQQGRFQLVIALESQQHAAHVGLVERLTLQFPDCFLVPPVTGLPLVGLQPQHFFRHDVLMLGLGSNLTSLPRQLLKRSFDIAGALGALLLLAPVLLVLALLVRSDGGPILFRQTRVGRSGRPFSCLKFRTMVIDAEQRMEQLLRDPEARAEWETSRKLREDPRVTRLGDFLRRTSLDELPQLFNVLRGDMSLVGPRPVVPEELECYGERSALYLQVRPGLTGLWQVSGRSETSYPERVALDAWYIRNWSLWYDMAILFKTVRVLWQRRGAW